MHALALAARVRGSYDARSHYSVPCAARSPTGFEPVLGDRDGSWRLGRDARLTDAARIGGSMADAYVSLRVLTQTPRLLEVFIILVFDLLTADGRRRRH